MREKNETRVQAKALTLLSFAGTECVEALLSVVIKACGNYFSLFILSCLPRWSKHTAE